MKDYLTDYKNYDLWILLSRTYASIAELREAECMQFGIPRHQVYILLIIVALGNNVTPTEISRFTYRKKNSVSEILNRMTKNGLVKKTRDPDNKSRVIVSLTEKGRRVYEKSRPTESIDRVMSVLSDEERQQLQSYLEKLLENAKTELLFDREKLVLPSKLALKASQPRKKSAK